MRTEPPNSHLGKLRDGQIKRNDNKIKFIMVYLRTDNLKLQILESLLWKNKNIRLAGHFKEANPSP